jgi:hypothetical protein
MLRWFENAARRIAVGYLPEVDDALSAESLTTLKRNFGLARPCTKSGFYN